MKVDKFEGLEWMTGSFVGMLVDKSKVVGTTNLRCGAVLLEVCAPSTRFVS